MPSRELKYPLPGYTLFSDGWGSPPNQQNSSAYAYRKYRARNWNTSPGFNASKRKNRKGYSPPLPMHPYTDYIIEDSVSNTIYQWKELGCPGVFMRSSNMIVPLDTFQPVFQPDFTDPRFAELSNKAIQKLPRAMNGTNFSVPIFLAEAKKTVSMVSNAATDIATTLSTGKTNRQIHNLWLEYRYGWRLLLKDIVDALSALHDMRTSGIRQRVKVTATSETAYRSDNNELFADPMGQNARCRLIYSHEVKEILGLTYTMNYIETTPGLSTLAQLGITNPMSVAWELIPYSFVADWFIPVSSYLSALDVYLGKSFSYGTVSKWYERTTVNRGTNVAINSPNRPNAYAVGGMQPGSAERKVRAYRRNVLNSFPSQSLPTIDISLNTSRMLDAISLIGQQKPALQRAWKSRHRYTE